MIAATHDATPDDLNCLIMTGNPSDPYNLAYEKRHLSS